MITFEWFDLVDVTYKLFIQFEYKWFTIEYTLYEKQYRFKFTSE